MAFPVSKIIVKNGLTDPLIPNSIFQVEISHREIDSWSLLGKLPDEDQIALLPTNQVLACLLASMKQKRPLRGSYPSVIYRWHPFRSRMARKSMSTSSIFMGFVAYAFLELMRKQVPKPYVHQLLCNFALLVSQPRCWSPAFGLGSLFQKSRSTYCFRAAHGSQPNSRRGSKSTVNPSIDKNMKPSLNQSSSDRSFQQL